MSNENNIKSISFHECPHCKKGFYVESIFTPPEVSSLYTKDEVAKAKNDCLERLETLSIEDDKKELVKNWLDSPDTIFGPSEVESIILSLLKANE